jgi:hypothetical protein
VKNATQFHVKSDHPEYKYLFDLDNPKSIDHIFKSYFPKLQMTQNSLQDIVQRTVNPNPGSEFEKASSVSNKQFNEIKTSIEKAKLKVLDIIPKIIDEEKSKIEEDKKQIRQKHASFK